MRTAENLIGRSVGDLPVSRVKVLFETACGNFRFLNDPELAERDPSAAKAQARALILDLIDDEVARLGALREAFDLDEIARERAESVDRVLFDASKEAILARKYEAAAERNLYKALEQLREVNAQAVETGVETAAEVTEVVENKEVEDAEPERNNREMGSFLPVEKGRSNPVSAAMPTAPAPAPRVEPVRPAASISTFSDRELASKPIGGSFDLPFTIGRIG